MRTREENVTIFNANRGLAIKFVNRWLRSHPQHRQHSDDLDQVCQMTLWIALREWDPERSTLSNFVWHMMTLRTIRWLALQHLVTTHRKRGHYAPCASLGTLHRQPYTRPNDEGTVLPRLRHEIDRLAPTHRLVLLARTSEDPPLLREIGAALGLTGARVQQIECEAIARVRVGLGA